MSNPPFGFGLPAEDPSDKPGNNDLPAGFPGGPGFDMSQLGAMLSQLGAMMSSTSPSAGPVNYDLARKLAIQGVGASHPVAGVDVTAVREAFALSEVWLDGATAFPAGARSVQAWTPAEWIDATMPGWQQLVGPIADRMGNALVANLPEELRSQAGPMLGMLSSMGGMAFGSQLGGALSQLANEVLTSTDLGVPLAPSGTAAVLPRAVAGFGSSLGIDDNETRLFLCAREAAHLRLYRGVPWLRDRILALIADYASHITVDLSAAEELASSFDPTNLASLQQSIAEGLLAPKPNPTQQLIAERLETLLALVEGWVDTVVGSAIGDRLPSAAALRETLRRRRATGGPAEQTFAALIGIELRPRRLRAAAQLWRDLAESRGVDGRDSLWSDYDLLPTSADLEAPDEFVARDKQFNELLASLDVADLTVADFGAGFGAESDAESDPVSDADARDDSTDDSIDDGTDEGTERPQGSAS